MMNYNELQWAVWLASPCPFRLIPVDVSPSEYLSRTLLLILDSDGEGALAIFNDNNVRVSTEQASELMELAQGHCKGECSVSEIKVGDKVRVVQIIVKDNDFVFTDKRVTYLGRVGEVVEIIPGYACPYFVLFPNTKGLKGNFCNSELKVLSVPCEQRELKYLREKRAELILANERLCERNAALGESLAGLQETYTNLLQAYVYTSRQIRKILDKYTHIQ